jgi:predicted site-specific integrase-resolvase
MKLSEWAKKHNICYMTAFKRAKNGLIENCEKIGGRYHVHEDDISLEDVMGKIMKLDEKVSLLITKLDK